MEARIRTLIDEARAVQEELADDGGVHHALAKAAETIVRSIRAGGKLLLCGNGGSAADCQHVAGEMVGRFQREREGLPAVALTTDSSIATSIGNDYGFAEIFRRQVEALGHEGDVLMAYSTSGNAANVLRAVEEAKGRGIHTVAMTGSGGGRLAEEVDIAIRAPSDLTPRIQECHAVLGHVLCEVVEAKLAGGDEE